MSGAVYLYDGSFEGLLSAIFAAYERKERPCDITTAQNLQPRLGQEVFDIPTDIGHAQRVQNGVQRRCGAAALDAIRCAFLSDDPQKGTVIYGFVRHGMSRGRPEADTHCPLLSPPRSPSSPDSRTERDASPRSKVRPGLLEDVLHPAIAPLHALSRAVYNERHRIMQFLRFEHLQGDVWFARCNPTASVVPLLMDWFAARFNTQAFMIYDEVHDIAGVYNGTAWYLARTDSLTLPDRSAEEPLMQAAWKRFYDAVAIESRYNPELRRQFMPQRLWKNITEMRQDIPGKTADAARKAAGAHIGKTAGAGMRCSEETLLRLRGPKAGGAYTP